MDGVRTVAIGTAVWALAFVVLIAVNGRLTAAGHGLWPWTCLAGAGLGMLGVQYCRRRRDQLRGAQSSSENP